MPSVLYWLLLFLVFWTTYFKRLRHNNLLLCVYVTLNYHSSVLPSMSFLDLLKPFYIYLHHFLTLGIYQMRPLSPSRCVSLTLRSLVTLSHQSSGSISPPIWPTSLSRGAPTLPPSPLLHFHLSILLHRWRAMWQAGSFAHYYTCRTQGEAGNRERVETCHTLASCSFVHHVGSQYPACLAIISNLGTLDVLKD